MSIDTPDEPTGTDSGLPKALHPVKKKEILDMWWDGLKAILNMNMIPRVLISIRVESHLEQKFQIHITYPGLTSKQALPLLAMAGNAIEERIRKEEMAEGPRLIIPKLTP